METAKADAVKEFRASQTFIDSCAEYYGDGFEDFLKQVKSIYPPLDLSKVSMDDPLLSTPAGDTVLEGSNDFSESEADPKDDIVVLAQPIMDQPIIPLTPLVNPPNVEDLLSQDVQDPPPKGGEIPQDPSGLLNLAFLFPLYCKFNLISRQCLRPFCFFFWALFVKTSLYLW